jgi:single-stranded-DNA-specific exonuclease
MSPSTTAKPLGEDLHPLAKSVLDQLDIPDLADWLNPEFDAVIHDPYLFNQMQEFVDRISQAIEAEERIVIFSDFDTDGIPAAVMWHDFFESLGYKNYDIYIPKRDIEGFGLKPEQVEKFIDDGVDVIITVDCGIRSHAAISAAKAADLDVIILDHHVAAEKNPPADIIINPALEDEAYPFSKLCGAGVVFKALSALEEDDRFELPKNFSKGQLDMVAIATISDMVPLVGENRALAQFGLRLLRRTNRPGLQALYEKGRIQGRELTEIDIGFTIGSHINAASRLDQPLVAFELLATRNYAEGKKLAKELHSLYGKRKRRTAKLKVGISKTAADHGSSVVIAFGSKDWKPALLGPVAHGLSDTYGVPVFLWGEADGRVKGSARAGSHNVVAMLESIDGDLLEAYGGHEMAGGFELNGKRADEFATALAAVADKHEVAGSKALAPITATLADLSWELYASLEKLGPFGVGNEAPLFRIADITVDGKRLFGAGNEHVALTLTDGTHEKEAIAFFASEAMKAAKLGQTLAVVGALEKSTFGFKRELRFRMEEISTT